MGPGRPSWNVNDGSTRKSSCVILGAYGHPHGPIMGAGGFVSLKPPIVIHGRIASVLKKIPCDALVTT